MALISFRIPRDARAKMIQDADRYDERSEDDEDGRHELSIIRGVTRVTRPPLRGGGLELWSRQLRLFFLISFEG